jgi:hypothetical protein
MLSNTNKRLEQGLSENMAKFSNDMKEVISKVEK